MIKYLIIILLILFLSACKQDKNNSTNTVSESTLMTEEEKRQANITANIKEEFFTQPEMKVLGNKKKYPKKELWKMSKAFQFPDLEISSIAAFDHYIYISDQSKQVVYSIDTIDNARNEIASGFQVGNINHHKARVLMPDKKGNKVFVYRLGTNSMELPIPEELESFQAFDGARTDDYAILDAGKHSVFRKTSENNFWISQKGSGPTDISSAEDIVFGDAIYVSDTGNKRIQAFSLQGKHLRTIGQGQLIEPMGMAFDGQILFVADPSLGSVLCYSTEGKLLYSLDFDFEQPNDVYFLFGSLYVSDRKSKSIKILNNKIYSDAIK